jgi:hypothetical protein
LTLGGGGPLDDLEFAEGLSETTPPFLSNQNPAPGAVAVASNTNVAFTVDDLDAGVLLSSVIVTINSGAGFVTAYSGGAYQAGFSGTVNPNGVGYDFDINPGTDFPNSQLVQVRVQATDADGNSLDTTYSFTTSVVVITRKVDGVAFGSIASPPPVETNPPFLQNQNPSPGQTGVVLNPVINFRITDAADDAQSGVDISTLVIRVQVGAGPIVTAYSAFLGGFQPGFAGTVTDVFSNTLSYDVVLDPAGIYPGLTVITVYVTVRDKQTLVINELDTAYGFTTKAAETDPPFLTNQVPAPGSGPIGNLLNTNISFRINDAPTDPDSGVDISTLFVEIKRGAAEPFENVIIGGVFQAGFSGSITDLGGGLQFDVVIDPATSLNDGDTTTVHVVVDDTKVPANTLDTTYSFQIQQADLDPPFVDGENPAPNQSGVAGDTTVFFEIHDLDAGVDFSTIDVTIAIDGTPELVVVGGVFQPGWTSSFFGFLPDGFTFELIRTIPIGTAHTVTVTISAQDLATVPNAMAPYVYQFFTSFLKPVCVLAQTRFDAVLGSIIQLDGRKSFVEDHAPLTWEWRYLQVPLGSSLEPDVGIINPASMKDLRPDLRSAVSFIPDKLGLYIVELITKNGPEPSDPCIAEVHVGLTRAYLGEYHSPPDVHFLWSFISNFWNLVEDRRYIETTWSAFVQVMGSELIKLWSNDYNKSLSTIQNSVQRHWVKFDLSTDLIDQVQRVIIGNTDDGTNGSTGALVDPGTGDTKLFRVPLGDVGDISEADFTKLDINYGAKGRIIDINGTGYTIERVFNTVGEVPVTPLKVQKLISGVYTDISSQAASSSTNVAIFEGSGHELIISHSTKFGRIRFSFASLAGANLGFTFEHSTDTGWAAFAPTDDTVGATVNDEDIFWDPDTLATWASRIENGVTGFHIKIRRNTAVATAPVEKLIQIVAAYTVAVIDEEALTAGLVGLSWRLPHLLHVPLVDFEDLGVSKGDTLVFEAKRKDIGLTAELRTQVVTVDRERIGFEFTLSTLSTGSPTVDHSLFRQLALDLRLVHPTATDDDIAAAAEALIAFLPTGINLSTRPFSEFQITFTAKKVIHNTALKIDSNIISIPHLQEELKKDPTIILQENWDFQILNSYLTFAAGLFTTTEPAPDALWAEVIHLDNSETVENNFGRLVQLGRDDLQAKATRAPYISAVKGLWFAFTRGPTVDAVRLGIQILMGLPFSEERGEIVAHTPNFTVDSFGKQLGRLLVEDVDSSDRRTGVRRFHYYPMDVGLETNPKTGQPYAVGDIFEAFVPLSKGVIVTDYVREPLWWVRTLHRLEVLKFFIFRAQIDVETGVFDHRDLRFALEFVRRIKPGYTEIVASALRAFDEGDILADFEEEMKGTVKLAFYDNVGFMGSLEATARADDDNHQGITLFHIQSRPFSTRSFHLLRDVNTTAGASVEAVSATGFPNARARLAGDATHPTVEGDILAIHARQPGGNWNTPGYYEVTAVPSGTQVTLGQEVTPYDPTTMLLNPLVPANFQPGSNLVCSLIRRERNPVIRGTDLDTNAVDNLVTSLGAGFISNAIAIDDHLIIESGANKGEYRVAHINTLTTPRDYTPLGTPQISNTQVKLMNLDGTVPTFTALTGQDFRVIRPLLMNFRIEGAQVVQSGGQMFIQKLDALDGSKPFDVFTPGLVGSQAQVSNAQNPANDGVWDILEYVHAGLIRVSAPLATSDATAQAIVTLNSIYHRSYEKLAELGPTDGALNATIVPGTTGPMSGSSSGGSTVTGTLTGIGALSGSADGASSTSGNLQGTGALSGSANGASSLTGNLQGTGALSGAANGASSVSGTMVGTGSMSGSSDGASTATGTLTGTIAASGSANGSSSVSGTLTGTGAISGAASGSSATSGTLTGSGALSGAANGASAASGNLTGTGAMSGSASGSSAVSGTLTGAGAMSGSSSGSSTTSGTLTGIGNMSGSADGSSTVTGNLTS